MCSLSASGLQVRLVSGLDQESTLTFGDAAAEGHKVGSRTISKYLTMPEGTNSTVLVLADGTRLPIALPSNGTSPSGSATVAASRFLGLPAVSVLWDLDEAWPTDGIDRARVRVVSALGWGAQVRAVTSDCYKCLKPVQTPLLLPGTPSAEWPLPTGSALPGAKLPSVPGYAVFKTAFGLDLDVGLPQVPEGGGAMRPGQAYRPAPPALCSGSFPTVEHSVMTVFVLPADGQGPAKGGTRCRLVWATDVEGDATWPPLVIGLAATLGSGVVIWVGLCQLDRCGARRGGGDDDMTGGREYMSSAGRDLRASSKPSRASSRVHAIDIWRGMCLLVMVFVNYGGGGYWWLDHSAWNGLTVADIVFACFVFTMGASMALSLRSQRKKGSSACDMTGRMAWRAAKLLAVGLFLNTSGGSSLQEWRLPGVLQYFAVAAVVVSAIDIWVPKISIAGGHGAAAGGTDDGAASLNPGGDGLGAETYALMPDGSGLAGDRAAASAAYGRPSSGAASCCRSSASFLCADVTPYMLEWILIGALEAVYLCVQFFLPVPGCPTGYLGPGGLADGGEHWDCAGGAHGHIDRLIFGSKHMYHSVDPDGSVVSAATCADTFRCTVYDPEGALGAINAVVIAYLGLQAGRILLKHKTAPAKGHAEDAGCCEVLRGGLPAVAIRWLVWAVACGLLAGGLSGFSKDEGVIPVTKNLWSPAYIVGMAGASFFMLALLLLTVDAKLIPWDGSPAAALGTNSIAVYCISEIFQMYIPFTIVSRENPTFDVTQAFRSHTEAMIANCIGVSCVALIAVWMQRNKIFIKL